jgi:hypothetical protein
MISLGSPISSLFFGSFSHSTHINLSFQLIQPLLKCKIHHLADNDDEDPPPPPPGLPEPFLFEPDALLIAQKLPPKLFFGPLAAVVPDRQVRYIIKKRAQIGAVCPACQFNWTTWKAEETRDKTYGGDLNLKAGKFNCHASACNTDPVPRSTFIICKDDVQLQAAIKHNCLGTGMINVPIKPLLLVFL